MVCTACEVWELAADDNFCAWCGRSCLCFDLRLAQSEFSREDYPPPVELSVTNTSQAGTIVISRIAGSEGWIIPSGAESGVRSVSAGTTETFLVEIDTFTPGRAVAGEIAVHVAYAGTRMLPVRIV